MSTTPSNATVTSPIDPALYYKNAANIAEAGTKRRQQVAIIEQAECVWGKLYLRRVAADLNPLTNKPDLFELVIQDSQASECGVFAIEASIVGKSIAHGPRAIFRILASTPDALAEVAKLSPAVKSALDALLIAQASATLPASPRAPRSGRL